jgi:hypothetical protein
VLSSATSTPIATTTSTIDFTTDTTTPIIATEATHKGKLLVDATVAPQAITFPTDVKLLNAAREKSEQLIDILYKKAQGYGDKPRTYREVARKEFLNIAKKKKTTHQEKYKAIDQQLRYVKRNLAAIVSLIDYCTNKGVSKLLKPKQNDYLQTIQKVYEQQHHMHITNKHTIENRIVNLHQPHVRPIVRGMAGKKTEFGSKLHVSLVDGFTFIDKLSWDNFNEGQCLQQSIQSYKTKFGYYPKEVLADKIYTTRDNRKYLKDLGIILKGKPLGRPSKDEALHNHISPSERNPIEGKFGQAKVAYGLERVRAKLRNTSEAWISSIVLVLNLVKLMRLAPLYLYFFIANLFFNKKLVRV